MEEFEKFEEGTRDGVYSMSVRAGRRTYFFDVKETKNADLYVTITERKRKFDQTDGKFYYEKHKIFLYKEDFDKFIDALRQAIDFAKENLENRNV